MCRSSSWRDVLVGGKSGMKNKSSSVHVLWGVRRYVIRVLWWLVRRFLSDRQYVIVQYYALRGRPIPDLRHPAGFNEKIQWLKINYRNPVLSVAVDKFAVRGYVDACGLGWSLNEVYGVYKTVEEIDFARLPSSFVMKATHGSGWNLFCRDRAVFDVARARSSVRDWLRRDYFPLGREWAYKGVPRRVLCERLLVDEFGKVPMDYKFFCFSGCPIYVQVDLDRFGEHTRSFYDLEWRKQPFGLLYPVGAREVERPDGFDRMVEMARVLSAGFPFVRVDLYNMSGKIYFGELTFYPGGGGEDFCPVEYDGVFGSHLVLPQ
jgi:hypothetical protein